MERLTDAGWTVYRGISSEPWPGGASLEMATVWARRNGWGGSMTLDRAEVGGISSALAVRSRVEGTPQRLHDNRDRSFQGTVVVGMGFVLSTDEASAMLAADPRNADVVRPYLIGEDLNTRPDASPSRWVIDFRDWPEERARTYVEPYARVERLVRPERAKVNRVAHRERWWQFGDKRPALYRSIASLDRCIAITSVSKVVQPMLVATGIVFAHVLYVFAYDDDAHFGLLSCGLHWWWAVTYASTLETRVRYVPTDCFETFPQPELTEGVGNLGAELNGHRSALMLDRQEGLTKTYNRVHDPDEQADDITLLREIHAELDYAIANAYGWTDLDLDHGFHETKFGARFTFAPAPRQEVLDRLLELNHERYAQEVAQGLHGKPKAKGKRKAAPAGSVAMELDGV